jgi:hypothetical protein
MSVVLDRPSGLTPTIGGSTYLKPSEMDWSQPASKKFLSRCFTRIPSAVR